MSLETVQIMMQAMSFSPATPVIRVAWNDPVLIKKALDIGAHGIIVPMVKHQGRSRKGGESREVSSSGHEGIRATEGRTRRSRVRVYRKQRDIPGDTSRIAAGVENIDDILSAEGIDAALLGPYDLSLNLGVLAQWESDLFKSSIEKILSAAKKHNVAPGNLAAGDVNKLVKQGFKFLVVDDDIDILRTGLNAALTTTRKAAEGS
jgi:4-hydroxy-2-oxoheptanedioate aldolase